MSEREPAAPEPEARLPRIPPAARDVREGWPTHKDRRRKSKRRARRDRSTK